VTPGLLAATCAGYAVVFVLVLLLVPAGPVRTAAWVVASVVELCLLGVIAVRAAGRGDRATVDRGSASSNRDRLDPPS
jgi:hypothetical protein